MSQTGYTPILIYSSSTGGNAPAAGNLTNSTLGSELAINITDGKLFYKDNANAVQVIGWKTTPTTAGGTGLTTYTAGDLLYYASGTTLTKLGIGTPYYMLGVNAGGTAPSWQPSSTSTLTTQGDLLYASAANTLARLAKNTTATRYLSNTGTNNNPAWAQINLANGVTGVLSTSNLPTGSILQVVTANVTGTAGTPYFTTTSSSLSDTGLSATITPTSSSSKILVLISANVFWVGKTSTTDQGGGWGLVRASTTLIATGFANFYNGANNGNTGTQSGFTYLDSPATTSATTYKFQLSAYTNNGGTTMYLNYNFSNVAISTITLLEVAG